MILGIDIGGTRLKGARVSPNGEILDQKAVSTPAALHEFVTAARDLASGLMQDVTAAGFGCKGIIHPRTTQVEVLPGTMHYLEGHRLDELFGLTHIPAAADNDARAALAGELRWGAAKGRREVLMLTLGTGVGGAIASGGQILRGASAMAGHIGHLTIDPSGAPCICGNRGCLETVFSARAIEAAAFSAIHRGVASRLLDGPNPPACQQVFALALEGDSVASDIVFEAIYKLGAAIAGLVMVFDPEIIVIGGQIAAAGEQLLDPLRQEVHSRTRAMTRRDIPIVPTSLADPSGVLGAAALALEPQAKISAPGRPGDVPGGARK